MSSKSSQTPTPAVPAGPYAAVEALIAGQVQRLKLPGAVLVIVAGGQVVHLRSFGRACPGGGTPSGRTPFFIGSLTKSFTALGVMQLVEAGKIELDAPLQRYLPWFRVAGPPEATPITVRHLLHQTSGLPMLPGMNQLANFDQQPDAAERQARALASCQPRRPAGASFEYSNLNYNLLGLVIEAASGEGYAEYIQRHIFDPLGMRHSYTDQAEARQNGLAVGHRYWFGVPVPAPNLRVPRGSLPSGQLISCAEDMARYLVAHLQLGRGEGGRVLSEAGVRALHQGVAEIREMGQSFGAYGMGWISQGSGATRIVSHSGIVPDYGAFMALVPEQQTGLVLLYNANHALLKMTLDELGWRAAQLLAGQAPAPPQFSVRLGVLAVPLLLPALQIAGAAAGVRQARRWRARPALLAGKRRLWAQHLLLPLVGNLSLAAALLLGLRRETGRFFVRLFLPDVYWTARFSAVLAVVWAILRTGLYWKSLRAMDERPPKKASTRQGSGQ